VYFLKALDTSGNEKKMLIILVNHFSKHVNKLGPCVQEVRLQTLSS
jgi:hypothetical protein